MPLVTGWPIALNIPLFSHIIQCCLTDIMVTIWLPQWNWYNPGSMGNFEYNQNKYVVKFYLLPPSMFNYLYFSLQKQILEIVIFMHILSLSPLLVGKMTIYNHMHPVLKLSSKWWFFIPVEGVKAIST